MKKFAMMLMLALVWIPTKSYLMTKGKIWQKYVYVESVGNPHIKGGYWSDTKAIRNSKYFVKAWLWKEVE